MTEIVVTPSREQLVFSLYEAAELEHDLMCTYLYAAFSLKDGEGEGLSAEEAEAVARWRRTLIAIAIEEMGHLAAVWNITAGLGASPRFGRGNFPIDPGYLAADVVVKLAPFNRDVLQHFIYLERPHGSTEPDGDGFEHPHGLKRGARVPRLTPMAIDYGTVGDFYLVLEKGLRIMSEKLGEKNLFCGDPALQLSPSEITLSGAKPVLCLKTALEACDAIIRQGEGAQEDNPDSHYSKYVAIRAEYDTLLAKNPEFKPAHPAAHNPVLRRPPNPEGRVWIEDEQAAAIVDIANSCYQLMIRLISYSYVVRSPSPEKALAVDLSTALMGAMSLLGESAARRPAGPLHPECNAGVSFTALRDSGPLPHGASSRHFFSERLRELAAGAAKLDRADARVDNAANMLTALAAKAETQFGAMQDAAPAPVATAPAPQPLGAEPTRVEDGVEIVEGEKLTIHYRGKRCIHSRWCVTGAPNVFLANVQGPWIHPDAMDVEELAGIARDCPSGAIQYHRNDGQPEEEVPAINLVRVLEGGPYAMRADIRLSGEAIGYRATLCRCGKSKNKPFCDSSHHDEPHFDATGEPPTTDKTDMLAVRDGPLAVDPQLDGPLMVRGNLEVMAGTGRMVARVTACKLCRCGHSNTKPFCDGTHAKIGFRAP